MSRMMPQPQNRFVSSAVIVVIELNGNQTLSLKELPVSSMRKSPNDQILTAHMNLQVKQRCGKNTTELGNRLVETGNSKFYSKMAFVITNWVENPNEPGNLLSTPQLSKSKVLMNVYNFTPSWLGINSNKSKIAFQEAGRGAQVYF